jgi:hypothetical protein
MPRKSANEIELATIAPAVPWTHERPDPPQGMPEAAAAVWRDAVASMKLASQDFGSDSDVRPLEDRPFPPRRTTG